MKTRSILLLLVVLVALSCLYYFDYRGMVRRQREDLDSKHLLSVDVRQIDRIGIRNRYGFLHLERRPDPRNPGGFLWWLTHPITEQADQQVISQRLLLSLAESLRNSPFALSPSQRDNYGLGKSAVTISLASTESGTSETLLLGGDTRVRGEIYLWDPQEPGVAWITAAALRRAFDRDLLELRSKNSLDFEFAQLREMTITRPAISDPVSLNFVLDESKYWLVAPGDTIGAAPYYRADLLELQKLFRRVQTMRVPDKSSEEMLVADDGTPYDRFLSLRMTYQPLSASDDVSSDCVVHLFVPPAVSATTTPTLPQTPTAKSDETPPTAPTQTPTASPTPTATPVGGPPTYAMVEGRNLVFQADSSLVEHLKGPLSEFRERQVFSLESEDLAFLQIEVMNSAISFERDNGEWRLAGRPERTVDQTRVQACILTCLGLRIESYTPDRPTTNTIVAGLESPMLRITMANTDRTRREGLEVGRPLGRGETIFYGRRTHLIDFSGADAPIFSILLSPAQRTLLMSNPSSYELKPPQYLMNVDTSAVTDVDLTLRKGDLAVRLRLSRNTDATPQWTGALDDQTAKSLPDSSAVLLVEALAQISYHLAASDVDEEKLRRYSLQEEAPFSVQFRDAAGNVLAEANIGDPPEDLVEQVDPQGGEPIYTLAINGQKDYYYVDDRMFREALRMPLGEVLARLR